MPLNVTAEALVKFVPVIVTLVPTAALVGEKLLTVGAGTVAAVTVNDDELVADPALPVTLMVPLVVPVGTVATICVAEFTV